MGRVLAHVFYVQTILGQDQIVSVFWTLTYEVQFYLVLVLAVMLGQRFGARVGWSLAIVPFLTSLLIPSLHIETHGWFILWWYAFAVGVATLAMLTGRLPAFVWLLAVVLIALNETFVGSFNHIAVSVTALTVGLIGRAGLLTRWTGGRILQWLGRRSYSLYLIHFLGAALAKTLSTRITGPASAALVFAASLLLALTAAEAVHRLIEAPAQWLAKSVSLQPLEESRLELSALPSEPTEERTMA